MNFYDPTKLLIIDEVYAITLVSLLGKWKVLAKKVYLFTLIAAAVLISLMSFQFYLGNKLLVERSSLIEAAEDIKLHATTAHLWFEEIMSGDSGESIAGVWGDLDTADWYAKAMLEG